jgi:hypothetical protein
MIENTVCIFILVLTIAGPIGWLLRTLEQNQIHKRKLALLDRCTDLAMQGRWNEWSETMDEYRKLCGTL